MIAVIDSVQAQAAAPPVAKPSPIEFDDFSPQLLPGVILRGQPRGFGALLGRFVAGVRIVNPFARA